REPRTLKPTKSPLCLPLSISFPFPLLVWVCPSRFPHLHPQISKARSPRDPPAPAAMSTSSTPVDASGEPIPTSSVLMAASKHIAVRCRPENVAFLNCKKKDPNPDKCLEKGRQVTRCVLSLLKELHQKCPKEMDAYAGCMYYYTNEFDFCRKEQQAFEEACPISE
ncbi:hypothetical protein PAHAL_9G500600, partial [Panicum hallii]